jgi:hypothetical protein
MTWYYTMEWKEYDSYNTEALVEYGIVKPGIFNYN